MKRIFAENAWLGPGRFATRVLVEFDSHIRSVRILPESENPLDDAEHVQWLMPGFINAHCHLEYSWLGNMEEAPSGRTGDSSDTHASHMADFKGLIPFGKWMQAIIASRPITNADHLRRTHAMTTAAQALIQGGCTAVIDSTTDGSSATPLAEAGIRHFLFHEVLGLTQQRAEPIWEQAMARIANAAAAPGTNSTPATPAEDYTRSSLVGHGINPHAPYSVGEWLREKLLGEKIAPTPQAWHLGETADEEELFRSGTGSIADFLRENGLSIWSRTGVSPVETGGTPAGPAPYSEDSKSESSAFKFLHNHHQLERCVIAFHGNTLTSDEAAYFAAPRALVHCPATHRWFERPPVPLKQWLDAGVNVCLGTDSLASSHTLSMLEVIRITLNDNRDLTADDVIQMVCVNPARISFLKNRAFSGQIREEELADFVALESNSYPELRSVLSDQATGVSGTWIDGIRQ